MAGEAVYPSRESYLALGQIAGPLLLGRAPARHRVGGEAQGRLDLRLPHDRQDARRRRPAAGHGVDRRGHHRAAAPRRRGGAPVSRAGGDRSAPRRSASCSSRTGASCAATGATRRCTATRRASSRASRPRCSTPTPEDRQGERVYEQLRRGGTARRVEQRKRKDGTVFWTRADGRAVDPHDPHKGSVWTVEDVTEQRRAEDELQRVLAEQQALLDNVVVGIAISRERKVMRCNRRFEEMFGFGAGRGERRLVAPVYFTDEEFELRGSTYAETRPGPHARARAMAAPPGRLGLLVPGFGARGRRRRPGARLRLADRGHQRAPPRRRGARAPGARAGRGAAERGHRHHLRQGPAHRALQPALRGDLRLRARAS